MVSSSAGDKKQGDEAVNLEHSSIKENKDKDKQDEEIDEDYFKKGTDNTPMIEALKYSLM